MVTYSALISACGEGQELRGAMTSERRCCSKLWSPQVTYNALISACGEGQELRRAFDVCEAMLRQARRPNMVSCRLWSVPAVRDRSCDGHPTSVRRCRAKL